MHKRSHEHKHACVHAKAILCQTNKETLVGIQIKALANELKKMLTFQNQKKKEKALGIYTEAYKYTHST